METISSSRGGRLSGKVSEANCGGFWFVVGSCGRCKSFQYLINVSRYPNQSRPLQGLWEMLEEEEQVLEGGGVGRKHQNIVFGCINAFQRIKGEIGCSDWSRCGLILPGNKKCPKMGLLLDWPL